MSVTEQAGKVVNGTVEALKTNPSCLAAILLAAMFGFLVWSALQRSEQRNHEARIALLERCFVLDQEKE